jgi:acyl CoA:acetate/3-ketoacid CoA transferase
MEDKDKAKFIALWIQVIDAGGVVVGALQFGAALNPKSGLRAQEIFEGAQALCYIEPERILRLLEVVLED